MNLKDQTIKSLALLWQTSTNNSEINSAIERELQEKILHNNYFSIEDIYEYSIIKNKAINVWFVPTTISYNVFGEYVTVELSVNQDEKNKILKNISSEPKVSTFGQVKCTILVENNQQPKLKSGAIIEFSTFHILDIDIP